MSGINMAAIVSVGYGELSANSVDEGQSGGGIKSQVRRTIDGLGAG